VSRLCESCGQQVSAEHLDARSAAFVAAVEEVNPRGEEYQVRAQYQVRANPLLTISCNGQCAGGGGAYVLNRYSLIPVAQPQ